MLIRPGIELGSLSDIGCQRETNEDFLSYWEPESDEQFQQKGRLAVVADGMGGYEGGQEASRLAVEAVLDTYGSILQPDPQLALLASLEAAHERIRDYAGRHPAMAGMGTTCTAAAVSGRYLYFAHVGDSRLYLARGPHITRLTRDHSYVGRLVESGILSYEEAESHPQRHILTAALGTGSDLIADYPSGPLPLESGDVLVLCTDGLWSQVHDEELRETVARKRPPEACKELVKIARKRGGPDNITVQVLRVNLNGSR